MAEPHIATVQDTAYAVRTDGSVSPVEPHAPAQAQTQPGNDSESIHSLYAAHSAAIDNLSRTQDRRDDVSEPVSPVVDHDI